MSQEQPSVYVSDIPILFRQLQPPEFGVSGYDGAEHSVVVLPAGHRRTDDVKAFEVDTIWEKDIQIPMRDGILLRGDIFRPVQDDPVPAIIPWSPYGKAGRGMWLPRHPHDD